ncbi:glycosyltransferase family 4 protein [Mucilaginibacter ginsenosidivorax]|nr:glycosyltransferase family 4 protein [Mucilaginibacter ginsenosidivorax]
MLENEFDDVQFFHVRMNFSREMNERGKLSFHKIFHILSIIKQTYILKFRHKIQVLYYPPSNAPTVSILRDVVFLLCTRLLFKKTIFHFHAAGISEVIPKMPFLFRALTLLALKKPDLAISSSAFNPNDGKFLKAKKTAIVPLGIPDDYVDIINNAGAKTNEEINVLFVGLLNSTKGEGFLLEAIYKLHQRGHRVRLQIAGKFETDDYKNAFFEKISEFNLDSYVEYLGVITGEKKTQAFLNADIFCFPSFFISESFGLVLLEAMEFKLPIVATRWRGIQSIVEENQNGYLVDIRNSDQLAERILLLVSDPELLKQMGDKSRELFIEKYTLERYINALNMSFKELIKL